MDYLFYVIGVIFPDDEGKAYLSIIIITIVWAFIWGLWAIAAFIELVIGYSVITGFGTSSGKTPTNGLRKALKDLESSEKECAKYMEKDELVNINPYSESKKIRNEFNFD